MVETAQVPTDASRDVAAKRPRPRRPRLPWWCYLAAAAAVVACFAFFPVMALMGYGEIGYMMILAREGTAESIGAACLLLSAAAFFWCSLQRRDGVGDLPTDLRPSGRIYHFLLCLFFGVLLAEELGWGFRWVEWFSTSGVARTDFSLRQYFRPVGAKQDTVAVYGTAAAFLYFAVLPMAAAAIRPLRQFINALRLPIPSVSLALLWFLASLLGMVFGLNPAILGMQPFQLEEAFELAIEILWLCWAFEEVAKVKAAVSSHRTLSLYTSLAVLTTVSLLFLAWDTTVRGWPATVSQQLYLEGYVLQNPQPPGEPQPEKAIEKFKEAARVNPTNDAAWFAVGLLLDEQNRRVEAIDYLRQAVRIAPDTVEYQWKLGQTYLNLFRFPDALPHIEAAIRLQSPNVDPQLIAEREYILSAYRVAEQMASHPNFPLIVEKWNEQRREKGLPELPMPNRDSGAPAGDPTRKSRPGSIRPPK